MDERHVHLPSFGDSNDVMVLGSPASSGVGAAHASLRVKQELMDEIELGPDNMRACPKIPRLSEEGRTCLVKLLIPNNMAGCIIGKGGDVMDRMKELTKARVKMGKANEFYPGTNDRVCVITGTQESVYRAVYFVVSKLTVRSKAMTSGSPSSPGSEEDYLQDDTAGSQVKFVVTDSTVASFLSENGGQWQNVHSPELAIYVASKSKEQFEERLVDCEGFFHRVMDAAKALIRAIAADSLSATFPNVVYHDFALQGNSPSNGDVPSTNGINHRRSVNNAAPVSVTPNPFEGVQIVFSLTNGVKDIISPEMLANIGKMLSELNGGDLRDTTETLGALSHLSSKGRLAVTFMLPSRKMATSIGGRFDCKKAKENGDFGGHGPNQQPRQNFGSIPQGGYKRRFDGGSDGHQAGPSYGHQQQHGGYGPVEIGLNDNQFGHFGHRGKDELQQWENITGAKIELISKPSGENCLRITGSPKDVAYADAGLKKKLEAIDKLFSV